MMSIEEQIEYGRKGMIEHFKLFDPNMDVDIKGIECKKLSEVIYHLENNTIIGQEFIFELIMWDHNIFNNKLVKLGIECVAKDAKNKRYEKRFLIYGIIILLLLILCCVIYVLIAHHYEIYSACLILLVISLCYIFRKI